MLDFRKSGWTAILAIALLAGCVSRPDTPQEQALALLDSAAAKQNNDDITGAMADLNKALALDPQLTHALVRRGSLHFQEGDNEAALADFEKALAQDDNNPAAYFGRAMLREEEGNNSGALEDLSTAISIAPKMAQLYVARGTLISREGLLRPGIEDFSKAIELQPEYFGAYMRRAYAYKALGERERAMRDLRFVRDNAEDEILVKRADDLLLELGAELTR